MTFETLPFWVEFGIIVIGTAILFSIFLWVARRLQKRQEVGDE
ncbi:MAG: hypothetical protein AAB368_00015 [bacterium]